MPLALRGSTAQVPGHGVTRGVSHRAPGWDRTLPWCHQPTFTEFERNLLDFTNSRWNPPGSLQFRATFFHCTGHSPWIPPTSAQIHQHPFKATSFCSNSPTSAQFHRHLDVRLTIPLEFNRFSLNSTIPAEIHQLPLNFTDFSSIGRTLAGIERLSRMATARPSPASGLLTNPATSMFLGRPPAESTARG